jgi:hypothetical protein
MCSRVLLPNNAAVALFLASSSVFDRVLAAFKKRDGWDLVSEPASAAMQTIVLNISKQSC